MKYQTYCKELFIMFNAVFPQVQVDSWYIMDNCKSATIVERRTADVHYFIESIETELWENIKILTPFKDVRVNFDETSSVYCDTCSLETKHSEQSAAFGNSIGKKPVSEIKS